MTLTRRRCWVDVEIGEGGTTMGTQTVTYTFADSTTTDTVTLTASTPATNSTGNGSGFNVSAVSGTIGAVAITGEVGSGGVEGVIPGTEGSVYDNVVFASDAAGGSAGKDDGQTGSSYGIDDEGVEFTAGGTEYNLFYETIDNNTGFELFNTSNNTTDDLSLSSSNAPCYCPGTLIAIPGGERPIELLVPGDLVITTEGEALPVIWIGRRSFKARLLADQRGLAPVCIRAGALGYGIPRRDLFVSPEHALLLDGLLVPARLLVNGTTIVQEPATEVVHYLHLELERHAALLAEGAAAESYADDNDSYRFHNGAERPKRTEPVRLCAPRVESGFALEAIRRRLGGVRRAA